MSIMNYMHYHTNNTITLDTRKSKNKYKKNWIS